MSWTQLGLFLAAEAPVKRTHTRSSKSKPIKKKAKVEKFVNLAPGELDDPLDDIFPSE
jgi:hypothetical protein